MANGWPGDTALPLVVRTVAQERRREPRVDVMMRVKGALVRPDAPILVHDLSRSGFAVLSQIAFTSGQMLDFRLSSEDGSTVVVTAEAIHSQPMPASQGLFLSGFMFVPGRLTGLVPQVLIDQLIKAVAEPDGPCFFERR